MLIILFYYTDGLFLDQENYPTDWLHHHTWSGYAPVEGTGAEASSSFKKITFEVITSFLNEEKERSKRRFNIILHISQGL